MKAVIEVDVPEYQIGQEVSVYFKDTMCAKSVCKKKQGTIEELKKLRLQIHNIEEPDHDFEGFFQCQDEAIEIISKAIDELKGE